MKSRLIRLLISLIAVAGVVWFCIPIHWRVVNVGSILGIAVCALVLLVCVFYPALKKRCAKSKAPRVLFRAGCVLFAAGMVWSGVLTGLMISGVHAVPPENATVVVLGSKVSGNAPSADLRVRIETAGDYLLIHPQAKCIASGGKGKGELRTEASVIQEYLMKKGISTSRILVEDHSSDTKENLQNSLKLIDQNGLSRELAIVTDDYHEYRAGQIAKSLGAVPYSVPAQTPWYIFSACYARELLALTKYLILP